MNNRFLLVVLTALFIFSCDHFVNLGDKSADDADYTEGLPDEISEDRGDTDASDANYDDWNEDYTNTGYEDEENAPADTEDDYPGDNGDADAADTTDSGADYSDSDSNEPYPDDEEWSDGGGYIFPESNPFYEGFSNAECDCGETPYYEPVCCNGVISVFNQCFANCYAINSYNKICTLYQSGLCSEYEKSDSDTDEIPEADNEENDQDTDIFNDNDNELSDSDEDTETIVNECGCYPENEPSIFRCGEIFFFITECLASCHCDTPEKLF